MWFKYQQERYPDFKVLEREWGFATYSYILAVSQPSVYIEDIYVVPEERKNNRASELSLEVQEIAKKDGRTHLLGSVAHEVEGRSRSEAVLLAHGMSVLKVDDDLTWYYKRMN